MDFRVLGPLEVSDDGRTLDLGGAKHRTLLAILLLHANEVVSADRLIDALWEGEPPETAAKALQVYISQLRKALGKERVQTMTPGYRVCVQEGELDLDRVRGLVADGRLEEALALWRGPPLSDFTYLRFAQAEIARLEELRLTCLEERLEADLTRGRHADVAGELEALVREHPLRERLREQLMLALYRSGRQAEALEAYQGARRALTEELGIEPGRELRKLEQEILRQDHALDLSSVVAKRAPEPSRGVFVGRERELAEVVGALEDALAGHARLVLVSGEPGIGKSRLADELIGHARARGAHVLVGRCWEAGGAPAYWPWVQALRAHLRETAPEVVRAHLGAGSAELAQLLPELREMLPGLPEPVAPDSEGARFRLFEAAAAFLQRAAQARPLVLVLDDLHAADAPSLLLLQFVAREIRDGRLLIVGAYRDVDPTIGDPLVSALAQLIREPQTRQIALTGLSEPEVGAYIERSAGTMPEPRFLEAIHGETDGNPLFVTEVVRLLAAEGRLAGQGSLLRIPAGVRAVIAQRMVPLPGRCKGLLIDASVLGREFGLDVLARLGELPRGELLELLDEAIAERVVGEVPGSPGRMRFGHALIRDTLYDDLTPARRLELHRRAGEALEAVYTADPKPHLAELAHHFCAAAPAGNAAKAIEYARQAADRAAAQLAYEEAVRLYEMALTLIDDPVARCELLLAVGDAQARAGDTPAARETFRAAAELAEADGSPEQLARAALGHGGRFVWDVSRDDPHLVPLLERALVGLGRRDSHLRVRLLSRFAAGPLRDAGFPAKRKAAVSREALAMARRIGDPATLAYALNCYIAANLSPKKTRAMIDLGAECIAVATAAGEKEQAHTAHQQRWEALLELGEIGAARSEFDVMVTIAGELRQPAQDWLVVAGRALYALHEGRFTEADTLTHEALELGERAQRWNAVVTYRLQIYLLRRAQGRLGELVDVFERHPAGPQRSTYPVWSCVLARFHDELGQPTKSRAAFDALAADEFRGLPFDEDRLVSLSLLAEVAHSLGDAPRATDLYDGLSSYGDRVAVSYSVISMGSVSRYLGLLASTLSRWDDAERHFRDALAMNERIGARPWLAHTQDDYARLLLALGRTGDAETARGLLDQALATYRDLGMEGYAASVSTLAAGTPST